MRVPTRLGGMTRVSLLVGLTLALAPATAGAVATPSFLPAVNHTLTSRTTTSRVCHDSSAPGRGIAHATYRAPMTGFVTVRSLVARSVSSLSEP